MLSRLFSIVVSVALIAAWHPTSADGVTRTLLVVGDSLSAGYGIDLEDTWVSLLQDRLDEQGYGYRVVNASISGDTSGGGLRRLPRALELHEPSIVLIELGGNDGLRGTPIMVMRENLATMIELSQERNALVLLAGMQLPPNYGADYARSFGELYTSLADAYDAVLIPFFMEDVAFDSSLMQADNIHPNAEAQPLLLAKVWTALEPELEAPDATELASGSDN